MPRKSFPAKPTPSLTELLAKSKELMERAEQAHETLERIAAEMEATRRLLELRLREQKQTVN
jgi:molecular chaperone GrpE (heat shock protein)